MSAVTTTPPDWSRLTHQPATESNSLFVGTSEYSVAVRREIALLGPDECTVAIIGPTGSGKNVVAHALHAAYGRGPLVRLPAPQLEDELLRSELLGHKRGAFTGAVDDHRGLVAEAVGGTLFVDDADDLSPRAQAFLLDVAEGEELRGVGLTRGFLPNTRLVLGLQQPLEVLVGLGRVRPDLFYRLDQERIVLQALAEHAEDIPVLTEHLLARAARGVGAVAPKLATEAQARLMAHDWPGNVRELDSVLQRAYRRARWGAEGGVAERLEAEHFATCLSATGLRGQGQRVAEEWPAAQGLTLEELEVLRRHGWLEILRELDGLLRRAVLRLVRANQRPAAIDLPRPVPEVPRPARQSQSIPRKAADRDTVAAALAASGGVVSRAAVPLGVDKRTLWRSIRNGGLEALVAEARAAAKRRSRA